MLCAVCPDPERGTWMVDLLNTPAFQAETGRFILVKLDGMNQVRQLLPDAKETTMTQLVMLSPKGQIVKRLSGVSRPTDLRFCLQQVIHEVATGSKTEEPPRPSRAALTLAMRGDIAGAEQQLKLVQPDEPPFYVSEAYGAIGDEWRVRGNFSRSLAPFSKAMSVSRDPQQKIRWRLRLALTKARIARSPELVRELLTLAGLPNMPMEDRPMVAQWAYRMANSFDPSMIRPGAGFGSTPYGLPFGPGMGVRLGRK